MEQDKMLRDAQYRKGQSIAYFNSLNTAVALVTATVPKTMKMEARLALIDEIKEQFLVKYRDYYETNVAKSGANYNPVTSIMELRSAKTMEELRSAWTDMSEDERRDGDVIKVKNELYAKLKHGTDENPQDGAEEPGVAPEA